MKKLIFHLLFIAGTIILMTGCSKKDNTEVTPEGPAVTGRTEGFLSTIGTSVLRKADTLYIHNTGGNSYFIHGYDYDAEMLGYIVRPRDFWKLVGIGGVTGSANGGSWYVVNSFGYYMGCEYYNNAGYESHRVTVDKTPGERNVFIANSSGNKFYLQPKKFPERFLNTMPYPGEPANEQHRYIQFDENKKQLWFFLD